MKRLGIGICTATILVVWMWFVGDLFLHISFIHNAVRDDLNPYFGGFIMGLMLHAVTAAAFTICYGLGLLVENVGF